MSVQHGGPAPAGAPGSGGANPPGMGALPGPGLPGLALAGGSGGGRRPSAAAPVIHSGSKFRHGLLQLMIHTIDPLHDGNMDGKEDGGNAIHSLHSVAPITVAAIIRIYLYLYLYIYTVASLSSDIYICMYIVVVAAKLLLPHLNKYMCIYIFTCIG